VLGRPAHEGKTVEVNWCPVVVVDKERQFLFSWLLVHEERPSRTGHVNDLFPEPGADSGADVSDVDASGQLEQPLREVPSQSLGT